MLICGESCIGKTQLVMALLDRYFKNESSIKYISCSTREDLKRCHKGLESIIFDDYPFETTSRSDIITILDRDRKLKTVETKFECSTLYSYQQIIIICNEIPKVIKDDSAILSRLTIIEIEANVDLRKPELCDSFARTTTRGNHLRNPLPFADNTEVIIIVNKLFFILVLVVLHKSN